MKDSFAHYVDECWSSELFAQQHLFGAGETRELERKLAKLYGMKHALCVSSATTGLFLIALAIDLRADDFITSPYTFGGSLASWLLLNNRPQFIDIDSSTLELRAEQIGNAITDRTKAVLAVDVFGIPGDTRFLRSVADRHGLWYIADCAQSLGATRSGKPSSYLADAIVLSFTCGKVLFAGEGGAVLTNNTELYEKLLWFSQHPYRQKKELGLGTYNEFGFNGRIHPLAAMWANRELRSSLVRLQQHQEFCFQVVDKLNDLGFTERIDFRVARIKPTFFRLSSAWVAKPKPRLLEKALSRDGIKVRITDSPIELVYRQPGFITQYHELSHNLPECPEAERQEAKRFCLSAIVGTH